MESGEQDSKRGRSPSVQSNGRHSSLSLKSSRSHQELGFSDDDMPRKSNSRLSFADDFDTQSAKKKSAGSEQSLRNKSQSTESLRSNDSLIVIKKDKFSDERAREWKDKERNEKEINNIDYDYDLLSIKN